MWNTTGLNKFKVFDQDNLGIKVWDKYINNNEHNCAIETNNDNEYSQILSDFTLKLVKQWSDLYIFGSD